MDVIWQVSEILLHYEPCLWYTCEGDQGKQRAKAAKDSITFPLTCVFMPKHKWYIKMWAQFKLPPAICSNPNSTEVIGQKPVPVESHFWPNP